MLRFRAARVGAAIAAGVALLLQLAPTRAAAQQLPTSWRIEDPTLAAYFEAETARLGQACLADVRTLADWTSQRPERHRQLLDMLGLWPMPERTPLQASVTRRREVGGFVVEALHFQSMPGLYVTANLYLPEGASATNPVPAILYVCGHAGVETNGVSYGNKVYYQHHGAWLARNGYACLTLDTLQLGEIKGDHHGTYRLGQWWWNARGYTPAGVEAWNSLRALDYLETRPEIDRTRLGMTGRSGGGSYTWTAAALDERIRVAAPVAGITDLHNQCVDGAVEGHCDCMFFVNTYRWDFPMVAALIAPRPLLVVNTDADTIFPLDGVQRLFAQTRRIYELHGKYDQIGLVIGPGGHQDTQDLQVPVLRWFDRHLRGTNLLVTNAAERVVSGEVLRAFATLPTDQRNTTIQRTFVPVAAPPHPPAAELRDQLRAHAFAGWPSTPFPANAQPVASEVVDDARLRVFRWESQAHVPLWLFVLDRTGPEPTTWQLHVLDDADWQHWLDGAAPTFPNALKEFSLGATDRNRRLIYLPPEDTALVYVCPRGLGASAWAGDARKQIQIRRRFQLLGQTADGMRVWDLLAATHLLRQMKPRDAELRLVAHGRMAAHALHAALFDADPPALRLNDLPRDLESGPDYLNAARFTDLATILQAVRSLHPDALPEKL